MERKEVEVRSRGAGKTMAWVSYSLQPEKTKKKKKQTSKMLPSSTETVEEHKEP